MSDPIKESPQDEFEEKVEEEKKKNSGLFTPPKPDDLVSFNDLLGTYRIQINRIYMPIMVNLFAAMFLAWLVTYKAGISLNAALYDPEETSTLGVILNGLIPVLMSAVFITIIFFIVKKFGLKAFKYIMGAIVLFYVWFGFTFYEDILFIILWEFMSTTPESAEFFYYLYYIIRYGSALYFFYLGYKFLKDKLTLIQKNTLVLLFGIFLGSIIGISFPTWTMFSFSIFLSIWDLITVFKGPLGKIAEEIQNNRDKYVDDVIDKIDNGELHPDVLDEMDMSSVRDNDVNEVPLKEIIKNSKIELGSGDLILYSALVSHAFVKTLSWLITISVIIGVLAGMFLTLYLLIKKQRVLPALPFSMLFGIIMFLISGALVGYF